jgi:hypothetical protein
MDMRSNTSSPIILGRLFLENYMYSYWFQRRECEVSIPSQEVYGALSKEEGECSEVKVPSRHLSIFKGKGMKPSYMAIKKALYGRQPGSIYFFRFYFCCLIRLKCIYNFLCSMLVLHQLLCVLFTLRGIFMHSPKLTYWRNATVPVPCFLLFLCFTKVTTKIFSELDKTKLKVPIFPDTRQSPKKSRRRARRWPHHLVARVHPWARHPMVWDPLVPSNIAPPPILSLRCKNPKSIGVFPDKVPQHRDTSQTYLQFFMLHAYLYTICFVFCYTSWHFYAFSRTNWYVSNVSIIFYAPCLFLHHLLYVLLHFMALLCIFRN